MILNKGNKFRIKWEEKKMIRVDWKRKKERKCVKNRRKEDEIFRRRWGKGEKDRDKAKGKGLEVLGASRLEILFSVSLGRRELDSSGVVSEGTGFQSWNQDYFNGGPPRRKTPACMSCELAIGCLFLNLLIQEKGRGIPLASVR